MHKYSLIPLLLFYANGFGQSIGINTTTPDKSAQLEIASDNKGLLIPKLTQAQRNGISNPATGLLIFQTDKVPGFYYNEGKPEAPFWVKNATINNTWNIGGNELGSTANLGTISNNHIDIITNNTVRSRITNSGEFFIGATSTAPVGDLFGVVANANFPFAINGYSSFNGSAVYGAITGGNTQFAAVQGEYQSSNPGIYNTAGVKGVNQSGNPGTGFRATSNSGPRVGVFGTTTISNGQYTFGIHGSMGSTDIRCAGIFGDDFGLAMGALGYFSASLNDYSVYGFGNAFQTGIALGSTDQPEANTQIGLGVYGGVLGGWVRGLVYGMHAKGEEYGLYVDGKTYTNQPITELVTTNEEFRVPAYAVSSLAPEVYARGKSTLQQGVKYVQFDPSFSSISGFNADNVVVTVSPLGSSNGIYIAGQDGNGFWVKENKNGTSNLSFSWIAVATRKDNGALKMIHNQELLTKDFDKKMNRVMYNDNNKTDTPGSIWWDGKKVRFDNPPPKGTDPVN